MNIFTFEELITILNLIAQRELYLLKSGKDTSELQTLRSKVIEAMKPKN